MSETKLTVQASVMIRLEGFAGQEIKETLAAACAVADRIGCWAEIKMNDIVVLIAPGDNPDVLWANFQKGQERGVTFVSANVVPAGLAALSDKGRGDGG